MAPRRLVVILIALLVLSSIAAALAPVPPPGRQGTTSTTPAPPQTSTVSPRPAGGKLVRTSVTVPPARAEGRREGRRSHREARGPTRIDIDAGDQLQLRVRSRRVVTLELRGIGETMDAGPDSPGLLDVLVTRPGRYPLTPLGEGDGDPVAVVVASESRSAQ